MSANFAVAYAENVNEEACDELSADFQALMHADGGVPRDIEREFAIFSSELRDAAAETRRLIAEIEAITR